MYGFNDVHVYLFVRMCVFVSIHSTLSFVIALDSICVYSMRPCMLRLFQEVHGSVREASETANSCSD